MDTAALKELYRTELLDNVLPFWETNALDTTYGGFTDFLDRAGVPLSTDKGGWVQGRGVWVFSTVYRLLDKSDRWLRAAKIGAGFIQEKLIGPDGRAWFELTREGKPLVMRRYLFTEMFAAMGLAEYGYIAGDKNAVNKARELYAAIDRHHGTLPEKIQPETRKFRSHSHTMMLINLCQVLCDVDPDNAIQYTDRIDK
ncbi:MAG: AGE family epimerase/isomerase, partial [Gammaproteobacteria bacterium]|nr:AGE family epimerase/isomerase [Gammaproteobacteria bacterium]